MMISDILACLQRREPLPLMTWALLNHALSESFLNDLFERIAIKQYSKKLLFSNVFSLMSLVVTGIKSSVGRALQSKLIPVGVSDQAFYEKLNAIEPAVCEALVQESSKRLEKISAALGNEKPPPVQGYRTLILDGNVLGSTEHRIDELRDIGSAPMPGKSLVILDAQRSLAIHMIACEDGWAQERSMSDQVIERVCVGDLYIADRNFCTVKLLHGIHNNGGAFLIREHKTLPWTPIDKLVEIGSDERGTVYEQNVRIEKEDGTFLIARRVVLKLPDKKTTRDGDRMISVLTTLPKEVADAWKVMELYQTRWSVETLFQTLTTTFRCEVSALGYPRAALFVFATALVAANVLSTVRAAIRSVHGMEAEAMLSTFYLVGAIQAGCATFIDGFGAEIVGPYSNMNKNDLLKFLRTCASNLDLTRYRKKPTRPRRKKSEKRPAAPVNRPHVSTARILASSGRKKNLNKISLAYA
jgi:hypothetical protein